MGRRNPNPLEHPERLSQSVYAHVAYRIGPGPDAEDATSEVFARAVTYRSSYDEGKGTPVAWLTGIARRVLAEQAAERGRVVAAVAEVEAPGAFEEDSVNRLTLEGAIAALGERDRELIALRYGADLTAAEIGTLLDLNRNAVNVALHRALRRLRTD